MKIFPSSQFSSPPIQGFRVKEWQVQALVLFVYFFASIFLYSEKRGFHIIREPLHVVVYSFTHVILFYLVTYVFLPFYLYRRKFLAFVGLVFISFVLFGIFEEGVSERILDPTFRGRKPVEVEGVYWFMVENVLAFFCFVAVKVTWDNLQNQQKIEALAQNSLRNELRFLRSQIHPHLLFNSLNNLYAYTLEKSEDAPLMVLKLSDILRYMLYECNQNYVFLTQELAYIEKYIDLQRIQMEGRGEVFFKVENQAENLSIAPFILISFIENCFKHSLETLLKNIDIHIHIQVKNQELYMFTSNPYKPHHKKENEGQVYQRNGIGLMNAKKRLALLYPNKYKLAIKDQGETYQVSLQMYLESYGKL